MKDRFTDTMSLGDEREGLGLRSREYTGAGHRGSTEKTGHRGREVGGCESMQKFFTYPLNLLSDRGSQSMT